MVERLLILRNNTFDEESDRMSQNQSFDTNDDDMLPGDQNSENNSEASKADAIGSNRLKPGLLLAMQSPSMDTLNDQEDSLAGDTTTEKVKKKKVRRPTEQNGSSGGESRRSTVKTPHWYTKIDFTTPLMCIGVVILLYLMWAKRDVWIPRLLTSNTRIRHLVATKVHQVNEKAETSKDAGSISNEEDGIDNDDDDDDDDDQGTDDDDDDTPSSVNKGAHQKLNVRIRRNKMSFSKDKPKKKHRRVQNQILDGEDDDDDDDDDDAIVDDDDDDDDDAVQDDTKNDNINLGKSAKESVILPSTHSSKNHHHHHQHHQQQRPAPRKKSGKSSTNSKSGAVLAIHDDIVEQLRKVVKSRGRHRDFAATLIKETGLNKKKINRFINQNDLSIITLDKLISFLNSFDSTILIVAK